MILAVACSLNRSVAQYPFLTVNGPATFDPFIHKHNKFSYHETH